MLKIRLQRVGRVHEPVFRLVLTDSKNSTKSGRFLEILGSFDARKAETAEFKNDRITYWMSKGVQVSDTVHNLLVTTKVITGKKINTLPKKKAIVKEVPAGAEAVVSATPTAPVTPEVPAAAPIETPTETVEAAV